MKATYTRLYSDQDGESHFEDLTVELTAVDYAPPAPALLFADLGAAAHAAFLGGPADWEGEWHRSSGRRLFVVITGQWEIEASDGEKRSFGPNDVLLVEDTTGTGHNSRVISDADSLALVVEMTE